MKTRWITAFLLTLLLLGLLPWSQAHAEPGNSGMLGENITWEFRDGTLTFSGEGYMQSFPYGNHQPWFHLRDEVTRVVFSEGIIGVGGWCLDEHRNLKEVQLPQSLKKIGIGAFYGCESLEEITLPGNLKSLCSFAFQGCSSLKSIVIPNSVQEMDSGVFKDCKSLETVVLSNKLERVDSKMFECCTNLKEITLPKSVTRINSAAFRYCYNLSKVEIKGKITLVDDFGFAECRSLVKLDFPSSLEWIGDYAFQGCMSLMEIWFRGDIPDMSGYDVFDLYRPLENGKCTLYYPVNNKTWTKELVEKYAGYYHLRLEPYGTPECDHKNEIIPGKAATCVEEGLTEGKRCTICGKVTKKQETIPVTEHTFTTVTVPPACTAEGFDLTVCGVCGLEERSNPKAPVGHRFGSWQTVWEATEDQRGLEARQCLYCTVKEERLTEKLLPAPTTPPPTEPAPTVPAPTVPKETMPKTLEPEPAQRRGAGLAILGILLGLTVAIVGVKRLYRKRA